MSFAFTLARALRNSMTTKCVKVDTMLIMSWESYKRASDLRDWDLAIQNVGR